MTLTLVRFRLWVALVILFSITGCEQVGREQVLETPQGPTLYFAADGAGLARARQSVRIQAATTTSLEAVRDGPWERPGDDPRFVLGSRVAWVHLRVRNEGDEDFILWQPHPWPIAMDVYDRQGTKLSHTHLDGKTPPSRHPRRGLAYRFRAPRGQDVDLYLRYEGRLQAPTLQVGRVMAFDEAYALGNLAHGLFYGLLLALMLYNAVLGLLLRSLAYAYYVLHVTVTALFFLARNLHLAEVPALRAVAVVAGQHQHLWTVLVLWLSAIAMTGFCRELLDTRRTAPGLNRLLLGVAAAPVVALLSIFFADARWSDALAALGQVVALFAILFVLVRRSLQRDPLARLFLAAWFVYLTTGLAYSLRLFGLAPYNTFTQYQVQVGAAVEMVLLSLALAYRIRLLEQARRDADAQAAEERQQREVAIGRERERGVQMLLRATDRDRRRIARDLHDGVGQLIAAARGAADDDQAGALLEQCANEVRSLSHGLHPDRLDRLGLAAALEGLLDDLPARDGLVVDADIEPIDDALSRPDALQIYRIAQEAVTNAFVHGSKGHLYVAAYVDRSEAASSRAFRLVVENHADDVDGDALPGLGLTSMRERAAMVGGELSIGTPEVGIWRVALEVPLEGRSPVDLVCAPD